MGATYNFKFVLEQAKCEPDRGIKMLTKYLLMVLICLVV